MKRLRRWVFNGLAVVSILSCLAIMTAWDWDWYIIYDPTWKSRPEFWNNGLYYHNELFYFSWWYLIILSAILPGLWLKRQIIHFAFNGKSDIGFCAVCGYDLRATPNQCPECGTIPRKPETQN